MTEWTLSSFHKAHYQPWRCAEMITAEGGWYHVQCSRKRGHGPEQAYCKQHSPEAKQAREDARKAKWQAEDNAWRKKAAIETVRREALDACRAIAAGHNNPRGLAQKVVDMAECLE